mgnify:FL=1
MDDAICREQAVIVRTIAKSGVGNRLTGTTGRLVWFPLFLLIVFPVVQSRSVVSGGEVRLKNGTILTGNLWLMTKLSEPPVGISRKLVVVDADPNPQNIILVDNGWQRYYVPRRQIPDADVDKNQAPSRPEAFVFTLLKNNQQRQITSVGSVVDVTPFDEFGHRTITLAGSKGNISVIQGISRIEPDHFILEGMNYNWKVGMSLKALPVDTLKTMLQKKVKPTEPAARFALVRFYSQADMFDDAIRELNGIVEDFPDQKPRADLVRAELVDYFGREVLRELNRRRTSGQHQLAYDFAVHLGTYQLGGAVLDDVRKFLKDYEEMGKSINRAKNLLVELQSKLKSPELIEKLQPLRAEINEQLNVETLQRLDAFLQSDGDSNLTNEQRLALAYSGWVVGAANAITDLEMAIRYWDARHIALEAARAETVQDRDLRFQELRRVEGVGPKVVLQLTSFLPAILDAGDIRPGEMHNISVTPPGHTPAFTYKVLLPPEYTPYHSYPVLIALRSRDHSDEDTVKWWGGGIDRPGPAMRRGYILVVPDYAEARQAEYNYSSTSHQAVIEALRDARKRFNVDSNRVFLAGHGMGADAAFDIGMAHPDEFAGVIPIGGDCQHYPKITYTNAKLTAWYVIGHGFSPETGTQSVVRNTSNDVTFEKFLNQGAQFDFMLVEYLGRGLDRYLDEVPKLFDWMDLHRRPAVSNSIAAKTLRKTDNRFYWVTAVDLPFTTVLPTPQGVTKGINVMDLDVTVKPERENLRVTIGGPAKRYIIRFLPEVIDFEKRIEVRLKAKDKRLYGGFVTPDVTAILNELRESGDRTRLPLATMEF